MLPPPPDWIVALEPDVGEVGHRQQVHDTPGLVVTLALRLAADGLAHGAVCTVATDDVLGADGDLGAVGAANRHQDRLVVGFGAWTATASWP